MFVNALGIYFFTVFIYTDMLYISIIKYDKNIILFIFSQRNAYVCRILSNRFVGNIRIIINKPVNRAKCPDNPIYLISSALSFLIFFHLKRHIAMMCLSVYCVLCFFICYSVLTQCFVDQGKSYSSSLSSLSSFSSSSDSRISISVDI